MRRPWNIVDSAVYSLATYNDDHMNMNVCTYVMAISRKPKLYAISVEEGSKTLEMLENGAMAVLQVLSKEQAGLIRALGKRSGHDFDKAAFLEKKHLLKPWKGFRVLKDASAFLLMKKRTAQKTGDHMLYTFSVEASSTQSEEAVLMFSELVDQGLILS